MALSLALAMGLGLSVLLQPEVGSWPVLAVAMCLLGFAFVGLYPATKLGPVEELRRLVQVMTVCCAAAVGIAAIAGDFASSVWPLACFYCVGTMLVGVLRTALRHFQGEVDWWPTKYPYPSAGWIQRLLKRVLDVVLASIALVMISPLLVVLLVVIRLDSPGPAVFRQSRPGIGGRLFRIMKYRTMHLNAEALFQSLPPHLLEEFREHGKIKEDPRITRAGHVLRKWSLDELPQLWNVLIGDMSLVGPRAYLVQQLADVGESKDIILSVRPGITGWWQVNGRSDLSFEQRLLLDTEYVTRWSIWLDLHIILKTVFVVLFARGAY